MVFAPQLMTISPSAMMIPEMSIYVIIVAGGVYEAKPSGVLGDPQIAVLRYPSLRNELGVEIATFARVYNRTDKKEEIKTANQGGKIEYRVTALKIEILDSQLDLCQAATLPNHFPKKNAAIEPNPNTSKVGGTILSNMSLTEPPKKDVPKFPCTILDNQLKYCFQIGKSRPSSC